MWATPSAGLFRCQDNRSLVWNHGAIPNHSLGGSYFRTPNNLTIKEFIALCFSIHNYTGKNVQMNGHSKGFTPLSQILSSLLHAFPVPSDCNMSGITIQTQTKHANRELGSRPWYSNHDDLCFIARECISHPSSWNTNRKFFSYKVYSFTTFHSQYI